LETHLFSKYIYISIFIYSWSWKPCYSRLPGMFLWTASMIHLSRFCLSSLPFQSFRVSPKHVVCLSFEKTVAGHPSSPFHYFKFKKISHWIRRRGKSRCWLGKTGRNLGFHRTSTNTRKSRGKKRLDVGLSGVDSVRG